MQVSQDILETQVANICDSICKRLHEICTELERLPYLVQQQIDHANFYKNLLAEDTGAMRMEEITRKNAAENPNDLFKSSEIQPGRDARQVVKEIFGRHEVSKPNPAEGKK
jgi:hypothetical protein